jgi:uncharacterized delta-60 repeat protein
MIARTLRCLTAAFATFSTASATLALPGDLDTSFGQQGRATSSHSSSYSAQMPDGRIVTAVFGPICDLPGCTPYAAIARYSANGLPDTGFGQGGELPIPPFGFHGDTLVGQADGKFLAYFFQNSVASVRRFNDNGSPDSGFGAGGSAAVTVGGDRDHPGRIWKLKVMADGRVLGAGCYGVPDATAGTRCRFLLAMLTADGHPDASFGAAGVVSTDVGSPSGGAVVTAVTVASDGRIVAGGSAQDGFALVKYLPDGRLDTGFGQGGKVTTYFRADGSVATAASDARFSAGVADLVIQPDGKLLVMGQVCQDRAPWGPGCTLGLVRYLADGRLDSSFANGARDGLWLIGYYHGAVLRLEADGSILVAMDTGALVRFRSDGSRDDSYGDQGVVRLGGPAGSPRFQPDGKLLAHDGALKRYLTDDSDQGVVPQTGLWVIDSEIGSAGRGFQIEMQRNLLMMVVNGYEANGAATFHVAGGTYANNRFTGDLVRYAGGVAIGTAYGPPYDAAVQSAHVTGSAGKVTLQFSDPTHGTITLPGEAPKAFSKFDFGVPPAQNLLIKPVAGLWAISAEVGSPGRGFLLEAQGNSMVMVFDGYTRQGEPTFYYAAAPLNADPWNSWTADLGMYAGGTSFGGPGRAAHATGSAGQARVLFWTATSGCLWLPGDTVDCRPIGKFDFGLQ